jgi:hypothetical protein
LDVTLSGTEIERAFRESDEDGVSAKQYTFLKLPKLEVSGRVDEYEPEMIRLCVNGQHGVKDLLNRIVEGAQYQVFRLRASDKSGEK